MDAMAKSAGDESGCVCREEEISWGMRVDVVASSRK